MDFLKKAVIALALLSFTGACQMRQGGTAEKPEPMAYLIDKEGCLVGGGTVGTSMDNSFIFAGRYCRHPQTGNWRLVKGDGAFGPTLAGQTLQAFIAGPLTAATQGVAGVAIAKAAKCNGCGGNNNFYTSASAGASADNVNQSTNTIENASTGW